MKTAHEILQSLGINVSLIIGGIIGSLIGMKKGLPFYQQFIAVLAAAFIANYVSPVIVDLFSMDNNSLPGIGFIAGYSSKNMLEFTMNKLFKKE
jgi:hypothetical protein